jgi:hypothetical protein
MYYKLICILYALLCGQNFILVKSGYYMDNLPNVATLAQKIVTSSVLPITEILAIENDKLNSTFLHVAFGSQSLLKPTAD